MIALMCVCLNAMLSRSCGTLDKDYLAANNRKSDSLWLKQMRVFSYIAESLELAVTDMDFDDFRANLCYSLDLSLVTQDGCFSSRQLIHAPVINKFVIEKKG